MSFASTHLIGFAAVILRNDVVFVGADVLNGAANAIPWPAGTTAGDQAIIMVVGNATPSWTGFSGWTTNQSGVAILPGSYLWLYSKVSLSAAEVSSAPSYTGASYGACCVAVYRNGAAITMQSTLTSDGGTTAVIPGFVKDAASNRIVSIFCDRDAGGSLTAPSGFTGRHEEAGTYFDFGVADVAAVDYTDSATVTWTNTAGTYNQCAYLYEITV